MRINGSATLPAGSARTVAWDGYTLSTESGYSATLADGGLLSVTVPTGTTRATAATAGVRLFVPVRTLDRRVTTTQRYPRGAVRVEYVSGIVDAGNTGIRVWAGIVDGTSLASASGVGATSREIGTSASQAIAAWRIAAGTEVESSFTASAPHDTLFAEWAWSQTTDRRATASGQALLAGVHATGATLAAAGAMATGTAYLMICVGLGNAANAGGSCVMRVKSAITDV